MKRMHELCRLSSADILEVARRNDARQQPQRHLEYAVRLSVVDLATEMLEAGHTLAEAADGLNLKARTLRQWQGDLRQQRLQVQVLGRPLQRATVKERNQVIDVLDELGPATGVPLLRDAFPDLARAELEDIVRRYRRVWQKLNVQVVHRLRWPIPGRVWAIDFSQAPRLIDGLYPYLLAVRDLASSQQLLWLPVFDLTAVTAQKALRLLFELHGAPLVLKMDNGSAFLADATQELLTPWDVIPLFSPAYLPRYNGAIEASIGSLKTRTAWMAALQGHPGFWTCDDVDAARVQANATARPRGEHGPTPDELWRNRTVITHEERLRFQTRVQHHRDLVRAEDGMNAEDSLTSWELRSLDRDAIRRALVDLGYLLFRRRRITLPIQGTQMTNL
jgi:transposase InsO family protein